MPVSIPPSRHPAVPGALVAACLLLAAISATTHAQEAVWKRIGDPPYAPALLGSQSVYDSLRDRYVVYERTQGSNPIPRVWQFRPSGPDSGWASLSPAGTPPPALLGANVVFDQVTKQRMFVFGGEPPVPNGTERYEKRLWELILSTDPPRWSEVPAETGAMRGRYGASACLDIAGNRLIVYGGRAYFGDHYEQLGDVWALPLGGPLVWTPLVPSGEAPLPRTSVVHAYDPLRRRLLIHGGRSSSTGERYADTWALSLGDTVAWRPLATTGPQPSRDGRDGFVDVPRDQFLLPPRLSGQYPIPVEDRLSLALPLGAGGEWAYETVTQPMPVLDEGGLAHDSRRGLLTMIGISLVHARSLGNSEGWMRIWPPDPPPAPPVNSQAVFAVDGARERVWLVGGSDRMGLAGLWELDPAHDARWICHSPGAALPDNGHSATFDPVGERLLVFPNSSSQNRIVEVSLPGVPAAAVIVPRDTAPAVRIEHVAVLDPVRRRLIVHGGQIYLAHFNGFSYADLWELPLDDLAAWAPMAAVGPAPGARGGHFAFYDDVRDRMVMFGGTRQQGGPIRHGYRDAWALSLAGTPTWTPLDSARWVPPVAGKVTYDAQTRRLWLVETDPNDASSSASVWVRGADDTAAWRRVVSVGDGPGVRGPIAYAPWCGRLVAGSTGHDPAIADETWVLDYQDPVPVLGSLVVAEVGPNRVRLVWQLDGDLGGPIDLARNVESEGWTPLARLLPDGERRVTCEDRDVRPGSRVAYRLSAAGAMLAESEVRVPVASGFEFAGASPHPARGTLRMAFDLPASTPVRLELFDVRGARVLAQDLGRREAGAHRWSWAESRSLAPGLYLARLVTERGVRTARVVLLP